MQKNKLVALIFIMSLGVSGYFLFSTKKSPVEAVKEIETQIQNAVIEPLAFEEITIPYLRKRNYESSLGEMTKLSENAVYTSYLTSYSSDGLKVNGLITKPEGEMPVNGWPAIVFIHGYIPPVSYKTTGNYVAYVDNLARNGFVVFKIDLRGHGDSEGEAGGGYYSSDYVVDALNAYAALQQSDFVADGKIGFWGHSMGGNVVMRAISVKKNAAAAVIWGGAGYTYQDLRDYGISDNSYRAPSNDSPARRKRSELMAKHGQFNIDSDFWKLVVPTNYLDGVTTAIQLDHAVNDDVVSIEYSRNLNKILDQTNIIHELKELPSGGHNISGASFNSAMKNTVDFYNKYLKD